MMIDDLTVDYDDQYEQLLIGHDANGIELAALIPTDAKDTEIDQALNRIGQLTHYELTYRDLTVPDPPETDRNTGIYSITRWDSRLMVVDQSISPGPSQLLNLDVLCITGRMVISGGLD